MSRGLGSLQLALINTIRLHGEPMTFADIRAEALSDDPGSTLPASLERSMRRALHRLASEGTLIEIGDGGPGDPYRYFIHPLLIALMCDEQEELDAIYKKLEADSGTPAALAKLRRKESAQR